MSLAPVDPLEAQPEAGGPLPATLPLFPLPDVSLFPRVTRPFFIFEPRYRAMVADALEGDRVVGMVALRPGFEDDYEGRPPVYAVGCAGIITGAVENDDGTWFIELSGMTRFRILGEDRSKPYRLALVEALPEAPDEEGRLPAIRERIDVMLVLAGGEPSPAEATDEQVVHVVAGSAGETPADRQALLELDGPAARGAAVLAWLERTNGPYRPNVKLPPWAVN